MSYVIQTENLGKRYRLGVMNRRMLGDDIRNFIARFGNRPSKGKIPGLGGVPAGMMRNTNEIWALRDVSVEINDGDVVGIIGRNGSGKSTFLKILSRITSPTTGQVRIRGKVASLLEVGTGFHPELTGRENIYLNGSILGMKQKEIDAKLDEIVDFSGVERFLDTPVKRYSSGMQVRLAFAVAAHLEPDILVIDEVLAVGDTAFQRKCLGKIGDAAKDGRTVLFVSHNAVAVENLCRKGIFLDKGKVVFVGTQTEALARYGESLEGTTKSMAVRDDHRGNGAIRIKNIEFRSVDGEFLPTVAVGMDFDVWMHFETNGRKEFRDLHVEFFILSHFEVPLFTQSNRLSGSRFEVLPERGAFVCRIRNLPLPASQYRLNYLVRSNMDYELLDRLDHAVDMQVGEANFFGSGAIPSQQSGCFYVKGDWRIES